MGFFMLVHWVWELMEKLESGLRWLLCLWACGKGGGGLNAF